MAGTVVHLVVADKLLEPLNIKNPALFYCGNLAPDAIMARQNYVRDMKTHTHFKDGQKPYEFRIPASQEIYMKRLMAFYDEMLVNGCEKDRELYLGYLVHILVDELYLLDYYEEILVKVEASGIDFEDKQLCDGFISDVDQIDWELVRTYTFQYPMPDILFKEMEYEIPGWISNEELTSSKLFIIHKNFQTQHDKKELYIQSYQRSNEFIEMCVTRIPEILGERFGLMF